MQRTRLWIGGQERETREVQEVRSPYDGRVVGEVCVGSARDLDDAVSVADRGFDASRRLPTHRRVEILEGIARGIEAHLHELAELITRESGKPIQFSLGEVARAIVTFSLGAGEARRFGGEVQPIDLQARAEGRLCLWTRVPRGPVAAISPFNFPLNLVAHKLSPAFAVGAPVVLKPPPQSPLTAFRLAQLCKDAGLPDEMLSVVHCSPEVGQRMVEDERMKVLSFTGSDAVGWKLKSLAGKKQVLLELGGNAPCVVDEDVDLDTVMDPIVKGAWAHAGQVCIKIQRVFVHERRFDEFLERFVEATTNVPSGDPMDLETVVGPLIEREHVQRVLDWIREAVDGGARLHCGGEAEGSVVRPTVLTEVKPEMHVCKDEIFGPVTVVEPFADFEEALAKCNATRFGLQAGVFTRDLNKALKAFEELDYGGVLVGETPMFRVDNYPYGGTKDSGFGREGVRFAMEEMSEPKVLIIKGV